MRIKLGNKYLVGINKDGYPIWSPINKCTVGLNKPIELPEETAHGLVELLRRACGYCCEVEVPAKYVGVRRDSSGFTHFHGYTTFGNTTRFLDNDMPPGWVAIKEDDVRMRVFAMIDGRKYFVTVHGGKVSGLDPVNFKSLKPGESGDTLRRYTGDLALSAEPVI